MVVAFFLKRDGPEQEIEFRHILEM